MPVMVKAYYGINHKNRMFPTVLCPYLGQFTVARAALDSQLYQHPANPSDSHRSEEGAAQRGRCYEDMRAYPSTYKEAIQVT